MLAGPAPQQRAAAPAEDLRRVEARAVVERAPRRRPEPGPSAYHVQITEEIPRASEDVRAGDPAPQRDDQRPAIAERHEVRALPDVRRRDASRDRVLDREQRTELGPGVEVVAVVDEDARRAGTLGVAGALDRIAMPVELEDEGITGVGDRRVVRYRGHRRPSLLPGLHLDVAAREQHNGPGSLIGHGAVHRGGHAAVVDDAPAPAPEPIELVRPRDQRYRLLPPAGE